MSEELLFEIDEAERPAIEYMLERVTTVGGKAVAQGHVTRITLRNDLTRQFGGQYTADKMGQEWVYETNLPTDFLVDITEEDVASSGSNMRVVEQVAKRLSRALDMNVYTSTIEHHERVTADRKAATELRKEEHQKKIGRTAIEIAKTSREEY